MISTNDLPKRVILREDGPREGFQALKQVHSTAEKLELIELLSTSGITVIETTAFVRADRVPQLADAEELCGKLTPHQGVSYHALYLNEQGLKRATNFPVLSLEGFAMLAVSEKFLLKNNNRTLDQAIDDAVTLGKLFPSVGLQFDRLMISTAFGDSFEGRKSASDVMTIVRRALERLKADGLQPTEVTFADTTGWGNPESVRRLVSEFRAAYPQIETGLHLHDTRGTGMANVYAGLLCGVERFDCSVGGMGGCPFAPGAAGNVPTEDVAFLCEELGIQTGIDLEKYAACAKLAERIVGVKLPGKRKDGGALSIKA